MFFFSKCNETDFPGGPVVKNPPADAGDTGLILINYILHIIMGFPGGSAVRNLPVVQETRRHGFGPWVRKIPRRRQWQPTSVFLPGKSHGQRSLVATVHGVAKGRTRLSD